MNRARIITSLGGIFLATICACGGDEGVVRVIDGDVVVQRATPSEAYALFLFGMLAEADGKWELAESRFKDAISADDRDPLLWAKYADVKCKIQPTNKDVDEAFRRADAIDPSFSAVSEARSACEARRKNDAAATKFALDAANEDPQRAALDAHANRLVALESGEVGRTRMLAATRAFAERPEAWEALVAFSLAHHDAFLAENAVENLLLVRANHFDAGVRVAISLAGFGEIELARKAAFAAVSSKPDGRAIDPLVARLAVDAMIANGNLARVEATSSAARVALGEAAARAWIAGKNELARALAEEIASADPDDADAAIVLAALRREGALRLKRGAEISSAAFIAFTSVLLAREGADAARAFATHAKHASIDGRDELLLDASVALCAANVLTPESDAERVELALRRGEAPKILPALDERHELAARLLGDDSNHDAPSAARKSSLKQALSREVGRDWLVTYAVVESARRAGALDEKDRAALNDVAPTAPILALRIAIREGVARDADKTRLRAIAITDHERSLAGM